MHVCIHSCFFTLYSLENDCAYTSQSCDTDKLHPAEKTNKRQNLLHKDTKLAKFIKDRAVIYTTIELSI